MGRNFLKKKNKHFDKQLFFLVISLTILGLIAVADASAPQALKDFSDKLYFVKQQAIWALVGIVILLITSKIHFSFWNKLALPFFIISLLALILVLIPGIGSKIYGARRWIFLGPISVQPSELIKISLIIYLAKLSESNKKALAYFIPLFLVLALVMLEPDLGTTLIVVSIGMLQIFASGVNLLHFFEAIIVGIVGCVGVILSSTYRRTRLLTFLSQTQDPLGKDYHIRQILMALGSGGLFGVGLGESRQKYLFLPEAATDSIFAVIAEELGFVGAVVIVSLFVFLIVKGFKIAKNAPDSFSRVLAVGVTSWIGTQVFLNIGSMVALVPLTGVPLPFFSYGGSALVTILLGVGILLNISKYAEQK